MTPAEEVELRAKQAGIVAQYVTAQVLTPEEVAINRFRADGWSPETRIDLAARKALLDEDDAGEDDRVDARGAEHAAGVAGVVARVAAREIPRATGVELLVQAFELDAEAADRAMGEAGRTWFTAPEPTHAAELDAMRADLAKAQASLRGHQAYTARLIQRAKAGGLELGAFTAKEPTEVGEGDVLEPGDVVAVPVQDGRADAGDDHWKEQGRDKGQFTSGPSRAGGPASAKPKDKGEGEGQSKETTPNAEGQEKRAPTGAASQGAPTQAAQGSKSSYDQLQPHEPRPPRTTLSTIPSGPPAVPPPWHHDDAHRSEGELDESVRPLSSMKLKEQVTALYLLQDGNRVKVRPEFHGVKRSADIEVNGVDVDLKALSPNPNATSGTVKSAIAKARGQARMVVVDARQTSISESDADRAIARDLPHHQGKLDCVRVVGAGFDKTYHSLTKP